MPTSLAGGQSVFEHRSPPLLFMEIMAPWLRKFGNTPWDALGYLQTVGYRHLFMRPDGLVEHLSTPEQPFPENFQQGYNVVSHVPDHHAWIRPVLAPLFASNKPSLPQMFPAAVPNE